MSFREKSAWISLVSYLGVYGYYFWRLYAAATAGQTDSFHYGSLLLGLIILLVIIQVVLTVLVAVYAALTNPGEVKAPRDERDKLIDLKATRIGFAFIMIGALTACVAIAFGVPGFYTANGLFLAVVAAEVAKNAGQIVQYRMDA
jgi:hypothetical protein